MLSSLCRLNILPCNAVQQVGNGSVCYSKHSTKSPLAVSLREQGLDVCRIFLGQFCYATSAGILGLRYGLLMVWIYAQAILAKVVKRITLWYLAILLFIVVAMRRVGFAINLHAFGVAVNARAALPYPTARLCINGIAHVAQLPTVRMMPRKIAERASGPCAPSVLITLCNRGRSATATHAQAGRIRWFADAVKASYAALQLLVNQFGGNVKESTIATKSHGGKPTGFNKIEYVRVGDSQVLGHFLWSHSWCAPIIKIRRLYHSRARCANQEAQLFNAGAGLPYASFTV